MDSEGMEGKLPKIFGSKLKVLISKVLIQMVKHICSEWIPSENIRFKNERVKLGYL